MIHRRPDIPKLDPKRLKLPRSPKVTEIRTTTYDNAVGEEGVEVLVFLESLSPKQRSDLSWTISIRKRIASALEALGEERIPFVRYKILSDPLPEEDPIGGD